MIKKIAYFIVGTSVVLAIIMSIYLYMEHSQIKIINISEAEFVNDSEKITIMSIEENDNSINITGYIDEDESIKTVNVSIIIWDNVSDIYYQIPTEFVEVASEEEVDGLMRQKIGFQGGFAMDRLEGKSDGFILYIYDQNNGVKRLFITNYVL